MTDLINRLRNMTGFAGVGGFRNLAIIREAATAMEAFEADSRLDTAMKLLRDNQSIMHFSRELNQADHDVLKQARKWK